MPLELGAQVLTYGAIWPEALAMARTLERLGFGYLFGHDHLYATGGNPFTPFYEGWTTLAAWAASTERIRLGLTVGANTFRNPGVVAKMAVTVDHISGGRSILGLGAGNMSLEATAHGIDPGRSMGERLDWLEDSLEIITGLLAGEEVSHQGDKYRFEAVRHAPGPLQARLPVLIGAEGEKRGLRIAARFADLWQTFVGPGEDGVARFRHLDGVLRGHAADLGRDAGGIVRVAGCKLAIRRDAGDAQRLMGTWFRVHALPDVVRSSAWAGTPEQVADWLMPYVDAGVGVFAPQLLWPYDAETLERLVDEVMPLVAARTRG